MTPSADHPDATIETHGNANLSNIKTKQDINITPQDIRLFAGDPHTYDSCFDASTSSD